MNPIKIFLLVLSILPCASFVFAENVTLTTYYPAPSGNYAEMTSNTLTVKTKLIFDAATPIVAGISGTSFYLEPSAAAAYALNGDGLVVASDGRIGIKKVPAAGVELDVSGDIAATTVAATTVTATGGLVTTGTGTLTVAGASTLTGGLVSGTVNINNATSGSNSISVGSNIAATGNITATGKLLSNTIDTRSVGVDLDLDNNTKVWGTLYVTGTVTASMYLHISDERLKEDIVPISGAIEKVQAMNGVYFKYKGQEGKRVGLIAQDVEKVVPEVVVTDKDGMKSVDYSSLVAVLVQAVKEQQVIIDDLKATVERNRIGR